MSSRLVYCEDAIEWLNSQNVLSHHSVVTSLPDISEFPEFSLEQWKDWFIQTASLILSRCPDDAVCVFYQSDIKFEGKWVDKAYLCQKAAESLGHELLWHKIVCRSPASTITFGRPSYSHVLCFSKALRLPQGHSSVDVLAFSGDKTWQRGMGLEACLMVAKFIAEQTSSTGIVNPFCGEGSMLAAAKAFNLNAIGIERSAKRARKAKKLELVPRDKSWTFSD